MKKSSVLLCVVVLFFVGFGNLYAAPVVWETGSGGNDHFYEAIHTPTGISWWLAYDQAVAAGGYLATITSETENNFVFNLIDEERFWRVPSGGATSLGPAIGGLQDYDQSAPDVGWNWITGETWAYTNFADGQPGDGRGLDFVEDNAQNYLHYFGWDNSLENPIPVRTWNDIGGAGAFLESYLIEWDSTPVPVPATMLLLGSGLVGLAGARRKFKK